MDHLELWKKVSNPPPEVLKKIGGGRLKGMTDINPQWRYKIMNEVYGLCGIGWKYTVDKTWTEKGVGEEVLVFVNVSVYVRKRTETNPNDVWSDPIPGSGGSTLIARESNGLHATDEAYKMATTDALSVALKMLGVGSAVYEGRWDGSKYRDLPQTSENTTPHATGTGVPAGVPSTRDINQKLSVAQTNADRAVKGIIQSAQYDELKALLSAKGLSMKQWKLWLMNSYSFSSLAEITSEKYGEIKMVVEKSPDIIMNYVCREPGQD